MENEIRYQRALELFEQENYEGAVELFIQLYEAGYEKEAIIQILYDCFITPNEAEFFKNYAENSEALCGNLYDQLLLDFIPVSDTKYYIFHKGLRQFFGSIDISDDERPKQEGDIHCALIADIWDLREMLPYIRMCGWNTCYILLGENRNEFLSFLKLPDIKQKYLYNSMIFVSTEVMKRFFNEYPEFYIPKQIISGHPEEYRKILFELHNKRLEDTGRERKNVFLSVCIPSYGRGAVCLDNVLNILQVEYDSEIEIVVSNNGSTEDAEGYEQIKNLRDSRITYFEFEKNQGYPLNVCKTLELARGQFVMFASDEDQMKVENLHDYMNYLLNNRDAGVIRASGIGPNMGSFKSVKYEAGMRSYLNALNFNYLTGVTLNRFWVQRNNVLERIAANMENCFVRIYMHIALSLLTSENTSVGESDIEMWQAMVELDNAEETGKKILSYMHYESRIEQQNSTVEFAQKVMNLSPSECISIMRERIDKTYFLCGLAYSKRTEAYREIIDWRALCTLLHNNNMRLLEHYREWFSEDGIRWMQNKLEERFFEEIAENPMSSVLTERELSDYKMVEEIAKYKFGQGCPAADIDYLELERKWREFAENI